MPDLGLNRSDSQTSNRYPKRRRSEINYLEVEEVVVSPLHKKQKISANSSTKFDLFPELAGSNFNDKLTPQYDSEITKAFNNSPITFRNVYTEIDWALGNNPTSYSGVLSELDWAIGNNPTPFRSDFSDIEWALFTGIPEEAESHEKIKTLTKIEDSIDKSCDKIEKETQSILFQKLDHIEQNFDNMISTLDDFVTNFDKTNEPLDAVFSQFEKEIESTKTDLSDSHSSLDNDFGLNTTHYSCYSTWIEADKHIDYGAKDFWDKPNFTENT